MQYASYSEVKPDGSWTLNAISNSLWGSAHDGEQILPCAVCGFSYTHILGACTLTGSDTAEAEVYEGTQSGGYTHNERRSALAVTFTCEQGHVFRLIVQQHKGENFMFYQALSGRTWVDIVGSTPGEQRVLGVPEETEETKLTIEMATQQIAEWSRDIRGFTQELREIRKQNEAILNRQQAQLTAADGNGSKVKK